MREKTGPLVAAFHRDWVQMDNGNAHWWKAITTPQSIRCTRRPPRPSWSAELDDFFHEVAFASGTFKDLLLSNVAFVNKDNAAIYGLDARSTAPPDQGELDACSGRAS